jgi:uncharacterized membrane protein
MKKSSLLLFFFCFFLFFAGFANCLSAEKGKVSEVSVSVPHNQANQLVEKIGEVQELINQKREEFKERKKIDANIFFISAGIITLIGTGIFLFNSYSHRLKRELRKEKRKLKKFAKRRKKH